VLVAPLFPQYSAAATASGDRCRRSRTRCGCGGCRRCARSTVSTTIPGYIKALARNVNDYWMKNGRPDRLLMSFHGLPRRSLDRGDPYHCQCRKDRPPARGGAGTRVQALPRDVPVAFRRGGVAEALYAGQPRCKLAKEGVGRVDVFCPGFVADCLETLEEIGIECKQRFLGAGGGEFHLIPCLNEHPAWIAALVDLLVANLGGWLGAASDAVFARIDEKEGKGSRDGAPAASRAD
jgi:ferrochelatase